MYFFKIPWLAKAEPQTGKCLKRHGGAPSKEGENRGEVDFLERDRAFRLFYHDFPVTHHLQI